MFTPHIMPNKRTEPSRIKREMTRKKVSFDAVCFPLVLLEKKIKRKFTFFSVNTKNISSHELKISVNSLVLRTREFTDIFITFDEIYLVFTLKK